MLLAVLLVQPLVLTLELLIDLDMGLAHVVQYAAHTVLRGHLELAGDMILHQLGKELAALVLEHIVEADAGADEHLLHPRHLPDLAQEHQIVGVVGVQIGTRRGGQAGPAPAHSRLHLLLAGGAAEVGSGAAHVVDVALEAGVAGQGLHLPQDALMAAGGDDPPLVEGQGAEVARPEAAPVVGHGEAHLLDGRHAPHLVIHGVGFPDVGQLGHEVQFGSGERHGRRIDHQQPVAVALEDGLSPDGVVLLILDLVGLGIRPLIRGYRLKGRALHLWIGTRRRIFGNKGGSLYICNLPDGRSGGQTGRNFPGGALSHAVDQQIRLAVEEDGAAHLVLPIVVVGKAAQTGLQAADHQRNVPKGLPHLVGIDDHRPVGPQAGPIARGIGVVMAALFGHGIVGHHGVDVAAGEQNTQPRAAQCCKGASLAPVRLGQDCHPVALGLQHPGNNGRAKGGVVDIGVAGDDQEVKLLPAPLRQIRFGDRQKLIHRFLMIPWLQIQCIFPEHPAGRGHPAPLPS